MNSLYKSILLFLFFISITSCAEKKAVSNIVYNSSPNSSYKESVKTVTGKLTNTEYNILIKKIEKELKTTFPKEKTILINYEQDAENCILVKFDENIKRNVINNSINLSKRISAENNTIDYFVSNKNSPFITYYPLNFDLILDSGYFAKNIFPENENCGAFFIIKPDGKYMKNYGSDYYSDVRIFLEEN